MLCHVNMSFPLFCPSKFMEKKESNIQNPPTTFQYTDWFSLGSEKKWLIIFPLYLGSILPIQQQKKTRVLVLKCQPRTPPCLVQGSHSIEAVPLEHQHRQWSLLRPHQRFFTPCLTAIFQIKSCSCLGKEKGNIYVLNSHVWK